MKRFSIHQRLLWATTCGYGDCIQTAFQIINIFSCSLIVPLVTYGKCIFHPFQMHCRMNGTPKIKRTTNKKSEHRMPNDVLNWDFCHFFRPFTRFLYNAHIAFQYKKNALRSIIARFRCNAFIGITHFLSYLCNDAYGAISISLCLKISKERD